MAISMIPAVSSPINATLSQSLRQSAAAHSPIVARLAKHHKTMLDIVKHHEKHCDTNENIMNH